MHKGQKITAKQKQLLIDDTVILNANPKTTEETPLDIFAADLQKYVDTLA